MPGTPVMGCTSLGLPMKWPDLVSDEVAFPWDPRNLDRPRRDRDDLENSADPNAATSGWVEILRVSVPPKTAGCRHDLPLGLASVSYPGEKKLI